MGATATPRKAAATRIKSPARTTPRAQAWAKLMARVGEEFPLECPGCGGDIRLIAFITEPGPIRKILTHLGEPLEPPPISPARGPPADWGEFVQVHDDRDVFQATDRLSCPRSISTASDRCRTQAAEAPGTAERRTGTRSAQTREKRNRRGMRGVFAHRFPTAEAPNLAAQGQSVSRKTVAEVPLTGLSVLLSLVFAREPHQPNTMPASTGVCTDSSVSRRVQLQL